MQILDFLLLAVIALFIVLAVRSIRRQKKKGGCCGYSNCIGCGMNSTCQKHENQK